MPLWGKFFRPLVSAAAGSLAILAVNSGLAEASYGPPVPLQIWSVPGGFHCIVTSQTAGPDAQQIGPLHLAGQRATVRVHRATFPRRVQVTVTEPFRDHGNCQGGRGIGDGGFPGFRAVSGIGVLIQADGSAFRGRLGRPLSVELTSPLIRPSSVLVIWNGRHFVRVRGAVVSRGSARAEVPAGTDVAVLSPRPHPATTASVTAAAPAAVADFLAVASPPMASRVGAHAR
jgi:hypothetical protein